MDDTSGKKTGFNDLLEKYLAGRATDNEADALFRMMPEHEGELGRRIMEDLRTGRFDGQTDAALRHRLYGRLPVRRLLFRIRWMPAAAAAVVLVVAGIWLASRPRQAAVHPQALAAAPAIPGGNKAVLVLGNGEVVVLDSAGNGMLAQQGGAFVSKVRNGLLAYGAKDTGAGPVFHTIVTPKGGTYTVVLPDGSSAWLNAASSIRFPTVFEKLRQVEVTGEAYFEVVKHAGSKFEVLAKGTKVSVLGTKFNIKAYADEQNAKVTLVEGSVRFSAGKDSALLKPGEQGVSGPNTFQIAVADVEAATAWKNGVFYFDDQPLGEIMREVGRWYGVEVEFGENAARRRFSGIMNRSGSIADLLKFMQLAGIRCQMENEKIIIKQ